MIDWMFNPWSEAYALSADWDNCWRTGSTVEKVLDEAHLSKDWLLTGAGRFVNERTERLRILRKQLEAMLSD